MADSRCGLLCSHCDWRERCGCGGCIETMGHPFHGECPIAQCAQARGLTHCGRCDQIPCEKLFAYSYLDPEHGDRPQGVRVARCREWAAREGRQAWRNVLLTSDGFSGETGDYARIRARFLDMLGMDAGRARVLFIPVAATEPDTKRLAEACKAELYAAGIARENLREYALDGSLTEADAFGFDVVYFPGGDTGRLLRYLRETGFEAIVKRMVYAGKVYVGVSAGSLIATPNIGAPYDEETRALALVNAYLHVHHTGEDTEETVEDTGLARIRLRDGQALAVRWDGFEVVEG